MGGRHLRIASIACALLICALCVCAAGAFAALPLARVQNFEELFFARSDPPSLVRLYFIPTAPVRLKWGSPRQLLLSTVQASLFNKSHPIGHVAIEVQYRGLDTPEFHAFTGASSAQGGESRTLLLKDDLAFSILERAWPGMMETEDDLKVSIHERTAKKHRLAVATFLISDETAKRLLDYHKALRADLNPRWYGFGARPRRSEGSGCSAFGASFLEVAGLLTPALQAQFSQTVRVPLVLMAGYNGTPRISLARAVAHRAAGAWARADEPHMLLEFFDPDRMFAWAMAKHAAPGVSEGYDVQPDAELPKILDRRYNLGGLAVKNVKAVTIDAREVATPTGPLLLGEPALTPMSDTSIPTVIRRDKVVGADGSFELRP